MTRPSSCVEQDEIRRSSPILRHTSAPSTSRLAIRASPDHLLPHTLDEEAEAEAAMCREKPWRRWSARRSGLQSVRRKASTTSTTVRRRRSARGNRGVLHNQRLACFVNVIIRLLAAALDGKDLAPLPGALKTFETFDLSSFSLQLVDGGATTQSLQMAPTKANINAKIERDVGDDAERAIPSRPDEIRKYALFDDAEICLRAVWVSSAYKVPCWRQNRYDTHRIKRDLSPQTDLTANA
ncbi:hypothetical protein LTR35_014065 [Friedmanniomyces endolithicus]|uniref:Uncharacterized protein n=1 Tax=Friedmanniomyces endolithicus TaxID=329885 RepID=A0AAN6JB80_9PEZI|nr:hypothetical protein LTR35_014065 [Friedmanniomyces endolithicus]KAK0294531.1 hypothetical protein LTS00_006732 [Friedmanniomyces endolithicus]KAK0318131.1 hypothetical protein LTR82_010830 [Friedmanniomyces endolithicus]KAK1009864.1 hypothetical protein LTR54_005660 [Friedmanniomyces endolithicus]